MKSVVYELKCLNFGDVLKCLHNYSGEKELQEKKYMTNILLESLNARHNGYFEGCTK